MDGLVRAGRILFAIAIMFFGIEFLLYAAGMSGPLPDAPWGRGGMMQAWLICIGFIVTGFGIVSGWMGRWVSLFLGTALMLFVFIHWAPALVKHVHNPGPWTVLFEVAAIAGGAFVIAAGFPAPPAAGIVRCAADVGRYLIAISLIVFAVQHFMYAEFVAKLVPAWIPAKLFWAYFTGAAFVATALSIVSRLAIRLAGVLLGTMFFLWVVLLHIPRVTGSLRNGNEMTSLFVAVAMSGIGFVLAGEFGSKERNR
jgi:hypothetical protein